MPSFINMFKNHEIDSEEDIPAEYREEIEQKLSSESKEKRLEATQLTRGVNGAILSDESEIKKAFSDSSVYYFGHGTTGDETVLKSILQNGLKTVNPEEIRAYSNTLRGLDSTTVFLGSGNNQLFEQEKENLNNWPHKDSKNIVIISLPKEYVLRITEIGTLADQYKPFYIGSEKQGFNLRPEFIKGIYNAETHSFTENANFYQSLDEATQRRMFEDIKVAYMKSYAEVSNVNPRETSEPLPFNEQEMEKITIEWYKEQLKKFREDRTFDEQALDEELHDMANEMTKTEFENSTRSVKDFVRDSREDEFYKDNDEWEVSDDW